MIPHEHQWNKRNRCIWCGDFALIPEPVKVPTHKHVYNDDDRCLVCNRRKTGRKVGTKLTRTPVMTLKTKTPETHRLEFLRDCLERAERLDLPIQARLYREELARLAPTPEPATQRNKPSKQAAEPR